MLELLARQAGGFLFAATQQSEAQNLADPGAVYAAFRGLRWPVMFGLFEETGREVVGPLHGAGAESGDGGVIESIGSKGFVVGPLSAREVGLQVLAFEAAAGVAAAKLLG
ncbi:hypothetical protein PV416_31195 [Streptomyces ipomoeae]|nr:hypothetical protein [Streptomyces ipomoeae]MDX2878032.1 hypothetical protein [Streptomyces ipomoeae]